MQFLILLDRGDGRIVASATPNATGVGYELLVGLQRHALGIESVEPAAPNVLDQRRSIRSHVQSNRPGDLARALSSRPSVRRWRPSSSNTSSR